MKAAAVFLIALLAACSEPPSGPTADRLPSAKALSVAAFPEPMTPENVMAHIEANEITSVDSFTLALPTLYKRNFVSVFRSDSPVSEHVSVDSPRVVAWGADADMILTWLASRSSDTVEFLFADTLNATWQAGVIDFSQSPPDKTQPVACATCHGPQNRPIWGTSSSGWIGTESDKSSYRLKGIYGNIRGSTNPRLSNLFVSSYTVQFEGIRRLRHPGANGSFRPNWVFSVAMANRHAEILFRLLKQRDDYADVANAVLSAPNDGPLNYPGTILGNYFTRNDQHIGYLSSGEGAQGGPGSTVSRQDYKVGDVTTYTSVVFLIMRDLYLSYPAVTSMYDGEETGLADLKKIYRDQFSSRGMTGMNYRAEGRHAIGIQYGAQDIEDHVNDFAEKVQLAAFPVQQVEEVEEGIDDIVTPIVEDEEPPAPPPPPVTLSVIEQMRADGYEDMVRPISVTANVQRGSRQGGVNLIHDVHILVENGLTLKSIDWHPSPSDGARNRIQLKRVSRRHGGIFPSKWRYRAGDLKLLITADGETAVFSHEKNRRSYYSNWTIDDLDDGTILDAIETGDEFEFAILEK